MHNTTYTIVHLYAHILYRPDPALQLPAREGVAGLYGRQWSRKKKKRWTIRLAIVLVILALLLAIGAIGVVVGVTLKSSKLILLNIS